MYVQAVLRGNFFYFVNRNNFFLKCANIVETRAFVVFFMVFLCLRRGGGFAL